MSVSKRYSFTINNWTEDDKLELLSADYKYVIFGEEHSPSTNTPHLQGYIVFNTAKRLTGVKKISSKAHWEVAKGTTEQNIIYCSKDGKTTESGERPKTRKEIGDSQKEHWQDVVASARDGTCEEKYPREFLQYNTTINRLYQPTVEIIDQYSGVWWYGPPGTGKSRKAREEYPNLYDKLLNKWWDGYVDEETVLIDDIGKDHAHMGNFLKRYADHYPFRAEYKGGSKVIRPKNIVVTSNYTIEEIWAGDQQMIDAIRRRFKVTQFPMRLK